MLPEVSRAAARRRYCPSATPVVFQEIEYGAVMSSLPITVEPTLKVTPATATLSEAVADKVTVPETVVSFECEVIETVGGVVSEDVGGGGGRGTGGGEDNPVTCAKLVSTSKRASVNDIHIRRTEAKIKRAQ